jgi:ATP-dependent Zn protease
MISVKQKLKHLFFLDVDNKILARMTPGFTGAEIENLVNTSICEAVHRQKYSIVF